MSLGIRPLLALTSRSRGPRVDSSRCQVANGESRGWALQGDTPHWGLGLGITG